MSNLVKKGKKGIALLWTMVIALVLLIVTGTIVGRKTVFYFGSAKSGNSKNFRL